MIDQVLSGQLTKQLIQDLDSSIALNKVFVLALKEELQRENKLISYEGAFKMLENDMYIAGIGETVLKLLTLIGLGFY